MSKSPVPTLRLRLTAAGERSVRSGHPWVYEASVRETNRPGTTGDLAVIYDRQDRFLAIGLFDASSVIRVRVLHQGTPAAINEAWFTERLRVAISKREGLFGPETTGWRLVNGENDGWPGLVADKYGTCLVLKLYTAAWLPKLDMLKRIVQRLCKPEAVVLRLSRNIQHEAHDQFNALDGSVLLGELNQAHVVFLENGARFEASVLRGQKTGFYLDQRDNRAIVGGLCTGGAVLNAFSFSGGFSVYAARGGATHVTDLDISQHALESSKRNHELNADDPKVRACSREWIKGDTFEWLRADKRTYNVIILDPPSMARREQDRQGAIGAYSQLAELGARRVKPNGHLACFSCSAHVSDSEFFAAAMKGVDTAGKFRVVRQTGHAADHPAAYEELKYLKGIYFQRSPGSLC